MAYIKLFSEEWQPFCSAEHQADWLADHEPNESISAEEIAEYLEARQECPECGLSKPQGQLVYILAKRGFSLNYLGFGFRVCDDVELGGVILEGPATAGSWMLSRLASGLQLAASEIWGDYDSALITQNMLADLGY